LFHIADELCSRHLQRRRNAEYRPQRRVHLATLQHADVGPVIAALKSQQFLRHLALLPGALQRLGKGFIRIEMGRTAAAMLSHAKFDTVRLQSIVLQSIL
jgi:hypothetical protein